MKRSEIESAFKFFSDEVKFSGGDYGNKEVYPHMVLAMEACAEKLDELDKRERERLKAIVFFKEEIDRLERAPEINGCAMTPEWKENIRMCEIAIMLLEDKENE